MDFAQPHILEESVATCSKIRFILDEQKDQPEGDGEAKEEESKSSKQPSLDEMLVEAANQAAVDLFLGSGGDATNVDASLYPDRLTPQTETIQANQLVVIFESFDNLKFCYAEKGQIFNNRNGHFHHDDFIGKPYGCKVRSRNNQGYGFCYLLKPTPELWARSLKHRTQIVHELDASMIVFYLNLRPNMTVVESGTGSGALSHCIMRTIAPKGHLYTYEFNHMRSEAARNEFAKNRVGHLVTVTHKDVCGKHGPGGFDRPQASVDAVILDLPEPWLAIPHSAHCLKPNARIASYSPCVEQSQRVITALKQNGFHSIKTMEFRLKEHYVDEVEYELAPKDKRPINSSYSGPHGVFWGCGTTSGGEDTGAEADNEKSEYETEGDQASLATAGTQEEQLPSAALPNAGNPAAPIVAPPPGATTAGVSSTTGMPTPKRRKVLVARPFVTMRGHTAFLTFATAGNKARPDPNVSTTEPTSSSS